MSPFRKLIQKLGEVWGAQRGRRARVLLYHSISYSPGDPFSVSPELFRSQMIWLHENGFRVISSQELLFAIPQAQDLSRTVVITFDDAFCDFFDTAIPILQEFRFPAVVFVPTGRMGRVSDWGRVSPNRPVMDEQQIIQAAGWGFELGSHTVNHASLPDLDPTALTNELQESLAYLTKLTGQNSIPLAYPYGSSGVREQTAARNNPMREMVQKGLSIYWAARAPHVFPELKNTRQNKVLDLGCNKGLWSRHWAGKGAWFTGVDYDLAVLKAAQQNRKNGGYSWPVYTNGSTELLPFQANTFQAIICLDVIDIVPNDLQAVQEIFRVLQPGGKLVMTVISRQRRQNFMRVTFAEHIRNYSRDELRDLLVKAGFSIQKEFTFYRRMGGLARELGAWVHQKGLGKIPLLNSLLSFLFTGMTYLDILVPEHPLDGGFGFIALKKDDQGRHA